jgi:hypothetical protein
MKVFSESGAGSRIPKKAYDLACEKINNILLRYGLNFKETHGELSLAALTSSECLFMAYDEDLINLLALCSIIAKIPGNEWEDEITTIEIDFSDSIGENEPIFRFELIAGNLEATVLNIANLEQRL